MWFIKFIVGLLFLIVLISMVSEYFNAKDDCKSDGGNYVGFSCEVQKDG